MTARNFFILREGVPVAVADGITWGRWFETADRRVAWTQVTGDVAVSTVFLGLDQSFGVGQPLLYETLVRGGEHDGDTEHYATREEAEAGHRDMVQRIKEGQDE